MVPPACGPGIVKDAARHFPSPGTAAHPAVWGRAERPGGGRRHLWAILLARCALSLCLLREYNPCMLDWSRCAAVERTPQKVSGAWVFKGTRVPVNALFENIEDGARLDEFLDWFPGVTREQAEAVLEHARRSLVEA